MELKDTWSVAEIEVENDPMLIRFRNSLHNLRDSRKYAKRIIMAYPYESENESGMPSEELTILHQEIENELCDVFEKDLHSVLAIVILGKGEKEWTWYVSELESFQYRLNQALSVFDPLPLKFEVEDDPDWKDYNYMVETFL